MIEGKNVFIIIIILNNHQHIAKLPPKSLLSPALLISFYTIAVDLSLHRFQNTLGVGYYKTNCTSENYKLLSYYYLIISTNGSKSYSKIRKKKRITSK